MDGALGLNITLSFAFLLYLKVDASNSCVFSIQPKVFIAPHTTEDVKVSLHTMFSLDVFFIFKYLNKFHIGYQAAMPGKSP